MPAGGGAAPPESFLRMTAWIYAVVGALGVAWTALTLIAARSLQTRRDWMLCIIVAGMDCLNMPLGTVLGICTLAVLNQPGVRGSFD